MDSPELWHDEAPAMQEAAGWYLMLCFWHTQVSPTPYLFSFLLPHSLIMFIGIPPSTSGCIVWVQPEQVEGWDQLIVCSAPHPSLLLPVLWFHWGQAVEKKTLYITAEAQFSTHGLSNNGPSVLAPICLVCCL